MSRMEVKTLRWCGFYEILEIVALDCRIICDSLDFHKVFVMIIIE